jgi:hypothetical protein
VIGTRKTIHREGHFGRYLPTSEGTGHLLYVHQGTLFAAPFDLRQLALIGAPQPLLEDVSLSGPAGGWNFDFSRAPSGVGTFVYMSWKGFYPQSMSIFGLDDVGKTQPLHLPPGFYRSLRFSPDSKRLVFESAPRPQGGPLGEGPRKWRYVPPYGSAGPESLSGVDSRWQQNCLRIEIFASSRHLLDPASSTFRCERRATRASSFFLPNFAPWPLIWAYLRVAAAFHRVASS